MPTFRVYLRDGRVKTVEAKNPDEIRTVTLKEIRPLIKKIKREKEKAA